MPTCVRASAETMPCVTVWPTPNGLPMASTTSPTCKRVGIGEVEMREALVRILQPQHREIAALVLEHDLGLELALVGERDLDLVGALDHVVVGDDEAGGVDDDAGAERALQLVAVAARHAEEAAEDRVLEQRVAVVHHLGGVDIDHRRRHPLHHRRIGERAIRPGVGTLRSTTCAEAAAAIARAAIKAAVRCGIKCMSVELPEDGRDIGPRPG